MAKARSALIWAALAALIAVPVVLAATSPYLAWRGPVYIASGFAGIIGLALIVLQPLLAGGYLPGMTARRGRQIHAWSGGLLIGAVMLHVVGLWITSAPDVIDALLFVSPTPFSDWGVVAMWALFAAAGLAVLRKRRKIPPAVWRIGHTALVTVAVLGTVVHALLIEGTMEMISKAVLCAAAAVALIKVVADLRVWALLRRPNLSRRGR